MANQPDNNAPIDWLFLLFNTAGFVWGFLLGGATGYFGNWLWDKFKPKNSAGHLKVEADNKGAFFTGRMTQENKEQVLKTLRATVTPTGSPATYGRSGTGIEKTTNRSGSK